MMGKYCLGIVFPKYQGPELTVCLYRALELKDSRRLGSSEFDQMGKESDIMYFPQVAWEDNN